MTGNNMLGRKLLLLKENNIYWITYDYIYLSYFPDIYYHYSSWNSKKFYYVEQYPKYALYEVD